MKILDEIKSRVLILDGALGTELLKHAESRFDFPEQLNLENPEAVRRVHADYLDAGADILTTNTLGANRIKLRSYQAEDRAADFNRSAVSAAIQARGEKKAWIAGSMGPTGRLLSPLGDLSVDEAFSTFSEQAQALAQAGADLLLIETQIDLLEARTALRAARSVTDIPIAVVMTYPLEDGRTVTGSDSATAAASLSHADIVGINCGGHPNGFESHIRAIIAHNSRPLIVYANAGVPQKRPDGVFFPLGPEDYLVHALKFHSLGGNIVGGCCGTTPDHIRLISASLKGRPPVARPSLSRVFRSTSRNSLLLLGPGQPMRVVGENINPFARKPLRREFKQGSLALARTYARRQQQAGADALDINLGKRGEREPEFYADAVREMQAVTRLPLFLDNGSPEALEAALRIYAGKAVINSVTGEKRSYERLLPLAARHGAAVLLLAMDENGIPDRAEARFKIIEDLRKLAAEAGLGPDDLLADPITLSLSTSQTAPEETLRTIDLLSKHGIPSVIGLSNLSFGLPRRSLLNSVFLELALHRGLDSAILNPMDQDLMQRITAAEALSGRDTGLRKYLARFGAEKAADEQPKTSSPPESAEAALERAILDGEKSGLIPIINRLQEEGQNGLDILERILTPALRRAGENYQRGVTFLPQLILSAEVMEAASRVLERSFPNRKEGGSKGKVVLATVRGDLHDIGKNIVALMMRNFGFSVIDLGKNVSPSRIIERAREEDADIIGLSALMTTTLDAMQEVVRLKNQLAPNIRILVGGAAVSPEFAVEIGADAFGQNAMDGVRKLHELLPSGRSGSGKAIDIED